MKRFVEGIDRKQNTLFHECLEDWIDEDNPVRAIDIFVEGLASLYQDAVIDLQEILKGAGNLRGAASRMLGTPVSACVNTQMEQPD